MSLTIVRVLLKESKGCKHVRGDLLRKLVYMVTNLEAHVICKVENQGNQYCGLGQVQRLWNQGNY